jgi:hypothetical protein
LANLPLGLLPTGAKEFIMRLTPFGIALFVIIVLAVAARFTGGEGQGTPMTPTTASISLSR